MKTHSIRLRTMLGAVAALVAAACASTPPNPDLETARSEYTRASADPLIAAAAPKELASARDALQRGDAAFKDGEKVESVDHYAYLARQRVQAAVETSRGAAADRAAEAASANRDRIVDATRTARAQDEATRAQIAEAQAQAVAAQAQAAAATADQRATDLAAQLAEAKQTDRGVVLTLGDVLFDTGRATLKPGAQRMIDEVSTFLSQHPERKVLVEGYTDSTGSQDTNQALSERRAEAVRSALLAQGVTFERVQVRGLGARYPIAGNESNEGRQQNRRVEVVFSTPTGMFQSPRS